MIFYIFSAIALITSIFCIFLFYDFSTKRKFLFADIFINDFEISKERIKLSIDYSELVIDDFEQRWKGHINKRTLKLYLGKLIEEQYYQQINQL